MRHALSVVRSSLPHRALRELVGARMPRLAARIGLIGVAATAGYLILTLFDGAARADDGTVGSRIGVRDVVAETVRTVGATVTALCRCAPAGPGTDRSGPAAGDGDDGALLGGGSRPASGTTSRNVGAAGRTRPSVVGIGAGRRAPDAPAVDGQWRGGPPRHPVLASPNGSIGARLAGTVPAVARLPVAVVDSTILPVVLRSVGTTVLTETRRLVCLVPKVLDLVSKMLDLRPVAPSQPQPMPPASSDPGVAPGRDGGQVGALHVGITVGPAYGPLSTAGQPVSGAVRSDRAAASVTDSSPTESPYGGTDPRPEGQRVGPTSAGAGEVSALAGATSRHPGLWATNIRQYSESVGSDHTPGVPGRPG